MQQGGQISGNGSPYRARVLQQPPTPPPAPDVRGRHRKRAELSRLHQEIRALQEELRELERVPPASHGCRELVQFIESCPDPFIPSAVGPGSRDWHRWFEPTTASQGCWGCLQG